MLSVVLPPPRPRRSRPPLLGVSAAIASARVSMAEIARLEAPSAAARPMNSRRETTPRTSRSFQIIQFGHWRSSRRGGRAANTRLGLAPKAAVLRPSIAVRGGPLSRLRERSRAGRGSAIRRCAPGSAALAAGIIVAALTWQAPRLGVSARNCRANALDPGWSFPAHENPRAREAGGRLQRQDPHQGGRVGGRTRQRQDVDESVRRDRGRGSAAPEGGRQGERSRRRLDRPGAGRRNDSHGARHGRRPRRSHQIRHDRRAARGRQDA